MNEKNNYQDEAEVREYQKGEKAQQQKQTSGPKKQTRRNKSKPKSNNSKPKKTGGNKVYPVTTGSTPLAYLNKYPQSVSDAASVSFERAVGYAIRVPIDQTAVSQFRPQELSGYRSKVSFPAIMTFRLISTIGGAATNTDGFNMANHALYAYIRSKNTGVPPFDPPMVGFYIQSISECIKLYTYLVRAIGVSNSMSAASNVKPYYLMNAIGFNYSEIASQEAVLRGKLNKLALRLSTLPIPKGMEYVTVNNWLFENVFQDAASERAQLYVFSPSRFLTLIEGNPAHPLTYMAEADLSDAEASVVDVQNFGDKVYSFSKMCDVLNEMIQRIIGSEDCQRVAAEILKAFDSGSLISIHPIAEGFTIHPMYDERVSMIIENAVDLPVSPATYYIDQDPAINGGAMQEQLLFSFPTDLETPIFATQPGSYIINFHKESITNQDVMQATLLTQPGIDFGNVWDLNPPGVGSLTPYFKLYNHGFLVIETMGIVSTRATEVPNTPGPVVVGDYVRLHSRYVITSNAIDLNHILGQLSAFDWHPTIYIQRGSVGGSSSIEDFYTDAIICDLDKYTQIPIEVLKNINEIAVLSGYSSAELGIYTIK